MRILIFSVSCKEIDDNEYCRCTIRRTYLRYQRFIGGSFQTGCENTTDRRRFRLAQWYRGDHKRPAHRS